MSEIVKVENVTKYFKQEKVLDDVNMNLETGHIYGIVGKNGAGKTVLFKIIAGFNRQQQQSCCRDNDNFLHAFSHVFQYYSSR